ncbi:MAG: class I SAM-dependent methyltransferase [Planctomycetes bacterium]|nr:class I SAM-dependent methyltransferase [Planctomycetota bacterium]
MNRDKPRTAPKGKGRPASRRLAATPARARAASPARPAARPASRRSEPARSAAGAVSPGVSSVVPSRLAPPLDLAASPSLGAPAASAAGAALASRPAALRFGPRFPEGDYDYTYLRDFMSLDFVPRNCRAAVFGCGKGEEAVYLSERGYRVTGLDSDRNSIGLARERAWLNSKDVDFMIGDVYESATLLPAESFGLASDRGFFRSMDPVKGERERRRFLDLVRRLLLPGGVFLMNATQVGVGRKAKATRRRRKVQDDLLVYEGGEVMGEVLRAGLEIVGRRQYPVAPDPETGEERADLLLYCRKS